MAPPTSLAADSAGISRAKLAVTPRISVRLSGPAIKLTSMLLVGRDSP